MPIIQVKSHKRKGKLVKAHARMPKKIQGYTIGKMYGPSKEQLEKDIKMLASAKLSSQDKDSKMVALEKNYRKSGGNKNLGDIIKSKDRK